MAWANLAWSVLTLATPLGFSLQSFVAIRMLLVRWSGALLGIALAGGAGAVLWLLVQPQQRLAALEGPAPLRALTPQRS